MNASHDPRPPEQHFHELLVQFANAMLVTRSTDGQLRSRPMAVAEVEPANDLWFVTSLESGKVDEIAVDPAVNVTCQNGDRFLSLSGRATLVRDPRKIDQLWNESWKVWFPEGKQDPTLVLLQVQAQEGEYWDRAGGKGWRYLFQAGKAYLQGSRPEVSPEEHQKINF